MTNPTFYSPGIIHNLFQFHVRKCLACHRICGGYLVLIHLSLIISSVPVWLSGGYPGAYPSLSHLSPVPIGLRMSYREAFSKSVERKLIPESYLNVGLQSANTREKLFTHLIDQRKWPEEKWDDQTIEILINEISSMDSNNFSHKVGVGEREGRIFSGMVARRHFRMCHGIGRSGDIGEVQPKAAGSSLLSTLTNALVLDMIKTFVSRNAVEAFILPMATGMSLTLVMLSMRNEKPSSKYVIWPRIDQKSCFKSILTAGATPVIIQPKIVGEELKTDLDEIESKVLELGAETVLCVMTTTSCFAPRSCDDVADVAKLCKKYNIYHLTNNAYGVQSSKCSHEIDQASRVGQLDVFVQSTDKNLMVPVGGCIVSGFNSTLLDKVKKSYPGRGSISQTLDVIITILSMGSKGYKTLQLQRKENFVYLKSQLSKLAESFDEHVLESPGNNISMGMSLGTFMTSPADKESKGTENVVTEVGAMLFRRNVSGARVVTGISTQVIGGIEFHGWGAHCDVYPCPYLTVAATIGMEKSDVDIFVVKLTECLNKMRCKRSTNLLDKTEEAAKQID